jgi:hypothetical protein
MKGHLNLSVDTELIIKVRSKGYNLSSEVEKHFRELIKEDERDENMFNDEIEGLNSQINELEQQKDEIIQKSEAYRTNKKLAENNAVESAYNKLVNDMIINLDVDEGELTSTSEMMGISPDELYKQINQEVRNRGSRKS